jgi:ammonia channel protein AmtB
MGLPTVHGICGIWGVLAIGLFGAKVLGGHPVYGLELADRLPRLGVQALGALVISLFVAAADLLLFFVLKRAKLSRVGRDAELFGLASQSAEPQRGLTLSGRS